MHGPSILAATLTRPGRPDRFGNAWQYHSRSDRHSKVACWSVLFDALQQSTQLRAHVENRQVVFGVNMQLRGLRTNRSKNLDLILARPAGEWTLNRPRTTLHQLAVRWGVRLDERQQSLLADLPPVLEGPIGTVLAALEAKACMTAHIKALPRLFDELNSSHAAVHANSDTAISVGLAMVNSADSFISPDLNKHHLDSVRPVISMHPQPQWATRTVAKLREIPRRTVSHGEGFDAFGITVVRIGNDGSAVEIVTDPPAPRLAESDHYDQMLNRFVHLYDSRNANLS